MLSNSLPSHSQPVAEPRFELRQSDSEPFRKAGVPSEQITFNSRETCIDCHRSLPFAVYHAIYLEELTAVELTEKIAQLFSISPRQISQIYKQGPTGIHVLISDEVEFQ